MRSIRSASLSCLLAILVDIRVIADHHQPRLLFLGPPSTQQHHQHQHDKHRISPFAASRSSLTNSIAPRRRRRTSYHAVLDNHHRRHFGERRQGIKCSISAMSAADHSTADHVSVLQLPILDEQNVAVVWFTACDLRTHDHDGLVASAMAAGVVPLYVFDDQV